MPLYFKSKAVEHPVVGLACPTGCLPTTPSASKKSLPWTARSLLGVSALQLPKNPLVGRAVPSAPLSLAGTIPTVNCPLSTVNCPPISSLQSSVCSISPVPAVNCPLSTVNCPAPSRLLSIIGILFAITVAAVNTPAQSQPFTPRLSLDVATRYNDNLLLSPTTPLRDFSEVVSPRVGFLYGQPDRTYIGLDYKAEIERFFSHEEFDANNQFITLDTQALFPHSILQLHQSFRDVAGPNSEIGGWEREQRNRTIVTAEYQLNSKSSLGLDYLQDIRDYLTAGTINSRTFVIGGTLYYHWLPKTDLLAQFNQGWVHVNRGVDAAYEELNVGFRGQLTEKITGTATVGYQHREMDGIGSSIDAPVAGLELKAIPTGRTIIDLYGTRTIDASSGFINRRYVVNRLYLTMRYRLFRSVMLSVGGECEFRENALAIASETYKRDILAVPVGVNYDLTKWLQLGATYRCQRVDYTTIGHAIQNFASLHVKIHY